MMSVVFPAADDLVTLALETTDFLGELCDGAIPRQALGRVAGAYLMVAVNRWEAAHGTRLPDDLYIQAREKLIAHGAAVLATHAGEASCSSTAD